MPETTPETQGETATARFPVGSRVRVRQDVAARYKSPWDKRFASGREGTVIQHLDNRWTPIRVEWDSAKAKKYAHDWILVHGEDDLELAPKAAT